MSRCCCRTVTPYGLQRLCNLLRSLAHMRLAMVRRTDTGNICQHIFATFAEGHDVMNLRVGRAILAHERRMRAAGNLAVMVRPQSRDGDNQRAALEDARAGCAGARTPRTTADLIVVSSHQRGQPVPF